MFGAQVIAEYERPLLFSRWGLSAPGLDYPTEPRATEAIDTLIYSVEELLWRLPAAADSEMGRLRDQATNALAAARSAIAGNVARARRPDCGSATPSSSRVKRRRTRAVPALEPDSERCALDCFGLEQCVEQLVSRRWRTRMTRSRCSPGSRVSRNIRVTGSLSRCVMPMIRNLSPASGRLRATENASAVAV
jgi:hypothetical protein